MKRVTDVFDVLIAGIPARAEIEVYKGHKGHRPLERFGSQIVKGRPIEPDEPAHWNLLALYDRKGYRARWLEKKLENEKIQDNLEEQFIDLVNEPVSCDL